MIIGLDVGGTHTDAVLLSNFKVKEKVKVTTDVSNLFTTIISCLEKLLKNYKPEHIKRIVLSTTLTTNAIVQQNTEKIGIIVSTGPGIDPEFFRTHENFYCVSGSIDHRGRQKQPINENEIKQAGEKLKENKIKYIGVIGKFSVKNPTHEISIKNILKNDFEKIFLGHNISGNLNFPRRISTTYLNALVYNVHKKFFNSVKKSLRKKGLKCPIKILKADGGTMSLESSMLFPSQSILSGPSASVIGSTIYAPKNKDTLVLDIGGTTTDIAILVNKTPLLEPIGIKTGNYKTLIRALKTYSIGLGGDSHVRVENNNIIIGPKRLGNAMAFNGPVPTPTDALVALKLMKNGNKEKALKAIKDIAEKLDMPQDKTAKKIFKQTCSTILKHAFNMVKTINKQPVYTVHEFLEGYQVNIKKILLLGGPAKYFTDEIQKISKIETKAVKFSSVANAMGAGLARTTCSVSLLVDTEQGIAAAFEENFAESVAKNYIKEDVLKIAYNLLKKKALKLGADIENMEFETTEFQEFNIVRNFSFKGKIFKTKVQIKPGLIKGYTNI